MREIKVKHNLWVKVAMVGLLLMASMVGSAQKKLFTQYKFHRIDESNGLTNNVVNDVIQDTLGQVWIGTNEGLFRYQGFGFQLFMKSKNNPDLLHNNFIDKLYLDDLNRVWLMTDDGVGVYSYEKDIIERFMPEQIKGRISSMAVDKNGNYYFGTLKGGISRVEDGRYSTLDLYDEKTGIDFSQYSILTLGRVDNYLWATVSVIGVIRYDLDNGKIVYFSDKEITEIKNMRFFDLHVDSEGKIWIGTAAGVFSLEVSKDGLKKVDKRLTELLPLDDYLTIFKDEQNVLWVGTRRQGMFTVRINGNGGYEILNHFEPKEDDSGVSAATISKIYQERSGHLWLGTHNGGLNVFNPNGEVVRTVTKHSDISKYSLTYHNVWGLCESADGDIWVGMDGAGMSLLNPYSGEVHNNVLGELEKSSVLCIYEDSQARLWVGTYSSGVYLYEKGKNVRNFKQYSANSELLINDIRCFFETNDGTIFVGTNQGGLYRYDEASGTLKMIPPTYGLDIRSIVSGKTGYLWLGTYGGGVLKFNIAKDMIEPSAWTVSEKHNSNVVFDVVQDGKILYVATRHNGVVVYDTETDEFIHKRHLTDLVGRSVSGIQMDGHRNLWMTTNTGVLMYDRSVEEIREYGVEDGFQSGHFNFGSVFCSRNGYLAIGGIHGMNLFYPDELLSRKVPSEIILNQLKIFNKAANPVNSTVFPEGKSIFLTEEVHLDYSDNIFSFQFSFPGFTSQHKDDFIYMLEGYERVWQYGAESNIATYRNVPPGYYTFLIKSLRGNSTKSLDVVISPPFWKTWWAYLIYTLLIMLTIWRLNKFNSSRIVLKQKLAFEKALREKEHHVMQEKLRFYTNFSHELKTPLTLIQGPVNDLLRSSQNKRDQQYLRLIKKNTAVILKFINRMLEFRKIEMNKTTLNVGKHDLKFLAQEEAESFAYLAKERGIKFGFYCENELEAWLDLEKIQIVLSNLLSNALKFTPEGKSVHFGIYERDSQIVIEIKDEGVGINQSELPNIFSPFFQASNSYGAGGSGIGLALSKSFIELHLGTIEVESTEGRGTKFTVRIPISWEKFDGKEYVRFIDETKKQEELISSGDHTLDEVESLRAKENEKMLLVVDDNNDILTYVESLFEGEFKVIKSENGKDAYEFAVNNTPDVIISDLMMPGMDGIEFCEKIKTNISTSHVPVIMLTAKDSKNDKIKGYEVGADGYVTKPFSSEVLKARVNSLIKNREMLELRYESNDLIDPGSRGNSREVEFVLAAEQMTLQMLEQSEFSVPLLCKELGMSQSALYRKIKSLTGVSIQVFIRKIRIKRAAQLLVSEDMTVSEIAFALEFSDLKYFRKCFKEQFGVSPSEFRANQMMESSKL